MFLTHVSALIVDAFRKALKEQGHPVLTSKHQDLWVGPEYPAVEGNYPGVWITFEPAATLSEAGVGHVEYRDTDGVIRKGTRWRFSGTISATVVSLSRRERDEIVDEVIRLFAFAKEHPKTSVMRERIETNPFIAVNAVFSEIRITGLAEGGPTPWGSEELVWEGTISTQIEGEFVSDLTSPIILVPIERIVVVPEEDLAPPLPSMDSTTAPGGWI